MYECKQNDALLKLNEVDGDIDELHVKAEGDVGFTVIGWKDLEEAVNLMTNKELLVVNKDKGTWKNRMLKTDHFIARLECYDKRWFLIVPQLHLFKPLADKGTLEQDVQVLASRFLKEHLVQLLNSV